MIAPDRLDLLDAGLAALGDFGRGGNVRGRFIALYLGLRRMGDLLAPLGGEEVTRAREIEQFMDHLLTKAHRPEPFVVLTAPFGGSTSANAPYSTRTGELAPGHKTATNTWRNNFLIQKGVGCPAEPETIRALLADPKLRLSCPHMSTDAAGAHRCTLKGTDYRGEMHSIWLRMVADGWQKVDLDDPAVYDAYLVPRGNRVPVFALIAALYCDAPAGAYPVRDAVGIPDFAADFGFTIEQVESIFECDPGQPGNAAVLGAVGEQVLAPAGTLGPAGPSEPGTPPAPKPAALPLPEMHGPLIANSGLGAELAVADDLLGGGWEVAYRGSQTGIGYDLEARREEAVLCVEVKSSVGFTTPELSESEWRAAREHGSDFVLAIVDFYGSAQQVIRYVRDPASVVTPAERTTSVYRFPRAALEKESTEADLLMPG